MAAGSEALRLQQADLQAPVTRPLVQRPQAGPIHPEQAFPRAPAIPQSMIDPRQQHPPELGNYVLPTIPPQRILTVSGIGPVLPQQDNVTARLDFTAAGGCDSGFIVGVKGTVFDSAAGFESAGEYEYATFAFQMLFNDSENLITDGSVASFVAYSDVFSPGQREFFPIYRRVSSTDILNFRFRNLQPLVGGNPLQGSLSFAFVRDPK